MQIVWRPRLGAILLALGLLAPIAVAGRLEPDPAGHGTHEQLGLPPCTMVLLFGVRCPACGMTTSWSCLLDGRIGDAATASVTGSLLCVAAMAAAAWLAASALRGRCLGLRPNEWHVAGALSTLLASMVIEWLIRVVIL